MKRPRDLYRRTRAFMRREWDSTLISGELVARLQMPLSKWPRTPRVYPGSATVALASMLLCLLALPALAQSPAPAAPAATTIEQWTGLLIALAPVLSALGVILAIFWSNRKTEARIDAQTATSHANATRTQDAVAATTRELERNTLRTIEVVDGLAENTGITKAVEAKVSDIKNPAVVAALADAVVQAISDSGPRPKP